MKKSRIGLLVVAALGTFPATSWAQAKAGVSVGASAEASTETGAAAEADATAEGDATGEAAAGEAAETPEEGDEGVGDICKIDPAACPVLDMKKEAARPIKEGIYAVQQIYVLRARRLEFNPWWNLVSLNDQFVQHPGPGVALNYYITNVLAIGASYNFYRPFNGESEFNAQVRRSARVAVPLTEYDMGAALNFTYVPAYGKFNGFGDFIFEYDVYVMGGVGALSTRPIPVIDPDNRNFDYEWKLAFNAGLGLRIFLSRWFAANIAVKDYIFNDKLEALTIDATSPQDQGTWYGENKLTNNVELQLGFSIFVPFSFDYRLPK